MTTPPRQRYRIVERGRRLVVIDTWDKSRPGSTDSGAPAARPTPRRTSSAPRGQAAVLADLLVGIACLGARDEDGRRVLTTTAYYDASGPREIVLGQRAEQRLGKLLFGVAMILLVGATALWAFPPLFIVAIPAVATTLAIVNSAARPAITRWLDRLEDADAT